jgi:hypothetical protein
MWKKNPFIDSNTPTWTTETGTTLMPTLSNETATSTSTWIAGTGGTWVNDSTYETTTTGSGYWHVSNATSTNVKMQPSPWLKILDEECALYVVTYSRVAPPLGFQFATKTLMLVKRNLDASMPSLNFLEFLDIQAGEVFVLNSYDVSFARKLSK